MVKVTVAVDGMMCGMCEKHMNEAIEKAKGHYGQWDAAVKYIDPRQE